MSTAKCIWRFSGKEKKRLLPNPFSPYFSSPFSFHYVSCFSHSYSLCTDLPQKFLFAKSISFIALKRSWLKTLKELSSGVPLRLAREAAFPQSARVSYRCYTLVSVLLNELFSNTTNWKSSYFKRRTKFSNISTDNFTIYLAYHSGRAVWGMNRLRLLERWDRGFESYSRHGCVCACLFCICVVICVGSGLATSWSPVQGVLSTVHKGCRAVDK
jgi:hypothetical protein